MVARFKDYPNQRRTKAMTEKKNDDYERPESHGEGDELGGVSAGSEGYRPCEAGARYWAQCRDGMNARQDCRLGKDN
jgi:hypothetical protein